MPRMAIVEAENAVGTSVSIEIRTSNSEKEIEASEFSRRYASGEEFDLSFASYIQYKLVLTAKSGCGTPRVKSVDVIFE